MVIWDIHIYGDNKQNNIGTIGADLFNKVKSKLNTKTLEQLASENVKDSKTVFHFEFTDKIPQ